MLRDAYENLKTKVVINDKNVEKLREYIKQKYPNYSQDMLSVIFAHAVHGIVDKNISEFDEESRNKIKDRIIKRAIVRSKFIIKADEIFTTCLALRADNSDYVCSLTNWLNSNQETQVNEDEINDLVQNITSIEEDIITHQMTDLIVAVEEKQNMKQIRIRTENTIMQMIPEIVPEIIPEVVPEKAEENIKEKSPAKTPEAKQEIAAKPTATVEDKKKLADKKEVEKNERRNYGYSNYTVVRHHKNTYRVKKKPIIVQRQKQSSPLDLSFLNGSALKKIAYSLVALTIAFAIYVGFTGMYTVVVDTAVLESVKANSYENLIADKFLTLDSKIRKNANLSGSSIYEMIYLDDKLQANFKYIDVNSINVKKWLSKKNSILVEEPYYSAIIKAARSFDINPLLLFAITGQEQGFVPKNNVNALKIANNPFNVYGSWQEYNTNIADSAKIAAQVIVNSSKGRPLYLNNVKWINRKYAQDPKWWKNVLDIFYRMQSEVK